MTTVLNPLAYKDIGPFSYYWLLLGTRNRVQMFTFLVGMQKAAVREDPGSFREEKLEEETVKEPFLAKRRNPGRSGKFPGRETGRRNGQETFSFKTPQSGKIPGRETGREKPTFRKPAVREDPGRFREQKREEM